MSLLRLPYDTVSQVVTYNEKPLKCNDKPGVTFLKDRTLIIKKKKFEEVYKKKCGYCETSEIICNDKNDGYNYGNPQNVSDKTQVKDGYFRVQCYSNNSELLYTNFHRLIIPTASEKADTGQKNNKMNSRFAMKKENH